jgi:hypothetical protein
VKRILPLSVFPDFGEKWEPISQLLDWMGYQAVAERGVQTFLCADLKVILVLIGQQSAASTHPCPYCLMNRDHFACNVPDPLHNCPNSNPRTFENNYHWFCEWMSATDGDKSVAKSFFNVVNKPASIFPENGFILDSVPPPELHIYIGIFNRLFDFASEFDKTLLHSWARDLHQTREEYWGGTFEGNESHHLMDCTGVLRQKIHLLLEKRRKANDSAVEVEAFAIGEEDGMPDPLLQILRIVDLMDLFDDVVSKCFGFALQSGYLEAIAKLKKAWLEMRWPPRCSVKVHILFNHIADWCDKNKRGLGLTSEQALESIHAYFKVIQERHLVKEIGNPRWAENMLQTVLEFLALNCII